MSLFSEREVKGTAAFVLLSGLLILVFTLVEPRPTPDLTETIEQELESRDSCYHLAPFDPNTADYEALRALGMTR